MAALALLLLTCLVSSAPPRGKSDGPVVAFAFARDGFAFAALGDSSFIGDPSADLLSHDLADGGSLQDVLYQLEHGGKDLHYLRFGRRKRQPAVGRRSSGNGNQQLADYLVRPGKRGGLADYLVRPGKRGGLADYLVRPGKRGGLSAFLTRPVRRGQRDEEEEKEGGMSRSRRLMTNFFTRPTRGGGGVVADFIIRPMKRGGSNIEELLPQWR